MDVPAEAIRQQRVNSSFLCWSSTSTQTLNRLDGMRPTHPREGTYLIEPMDSNAHLLQRLLPDTPKIIFHLSSHGQLTHTVNHHTAD